MKRRSISIGVVLALLLFTFWPWFGNPFAFTHIKDSVRASLPIGLIFGEPCATYSEDGVQFDSSSNCYRFDKAKTYEGIWLYTFEGSTFLENRSTPPTERPSAKDTPFLPYHPDQFYEYTEFDDFNESKDCYPVYAFRIQFIGRRNPHGRGHMGIFESEISVDKWLKIKPLSPLDCRNY